MMKKLALLLACVVLCSASPAMADPFVNGGFESGDFTGWNLDFGYRDSQNDTFNITWGQANNGLYAIWTDSSTMPGLTLNVDPYNGNYMARIGDQDGYYHATKLWQEGTLEAEDIAAGHVYVNWGAALVEPSNDHPEGAQPYFGITVERNGAAVENFEADALAHNSDPSWQLAGDDSMGSNLYYKSDTWNVDISGWEVGDIIRVELFVSDCGWGGHGAYAFLDGFGTTYQPPDDVVPIPAAFILGSLGLSFAGWLTHRRGELLKS
jgi:hypothetical protein